MSPMESVEQVGRAHRAFASAYDALFGAVLEPGRLVDRNQDLMGARGFIACETVCYRPAMLAVGLVLGPAHLRCVAKHTAVDLGFGSQPVSQGIPSRKVTFLGPKPRSRSDHQVALVIGH